MIICTYEDRDFDLPGVKLLIASLARHSPGIELEFSAPKLTDDFRRWSERFSTVRIRERRDLDGRDWNVKPTILRELLDAGHDEVVWMDSDLILHRDFRHLVSGLPRQVLVATEEPDWGARRGGTVRTRRWGLEVGRALPWTVNSCVVRVTREHRSLVERWGELLESSEYREAQAAPWYERPVHLLGDQEVLTALLGAREFTHVPLRILRRGRDIIQTVHASGYAVSERLATLARGLPPLVHAMRNKPWRFLAKPSLVRSPAEYYNLVHVELSPYVHEARAYRDELDEPCDWMGVRTVPARVLRSITLGNVALQGLPQAAVDGVVRRVAGAITRSDRP